MEAQHRGLDAGFFALKDWGIPDFCQLILITAPEHLQSRRDVFARFVRVLRRGIDFVHQQPESAAEIYHRRANVANDDALTPKAFAATLPCFTYDFGMTEAYYGALEHWMYERGLIHAQPGADVYWTNEQALPVAAPRTSAAM